MWKNIVGAIGRSLTRERLKRLAWYGALAGLLVILGSASYVYRSRNMLRYDRGDAALPQTPPPVAAMSVGTPEPLEALFVVATPTPEPTPEPLNFCWPVEGEILTEFAGDALVWSETLNQWQSHPGIDISATAGEAVVACAAGTVLEAWEDPLWGYVIEIGHPQGYVSTYANLNTLNMVRPGDEVESGEIIGAVGSSADCEAALPRHLHLELRRDGVPVDARKLFE